MAAKDKKGKDPKKKKKLIKRTVIGVLAFITLIVWWGMKPMRGPIQYGVCKTYAELKLRYPQTFKVSSFVNFDQALRIYFTYTDAYGETKMDLIECAFRPDPETGFALESITYNRRLVPQEEVDLFNKTIPAIVAYPPDLIIPRQEDVLKLITAAPEE